MRRLSLNDNVCFERQSALHWSPSRLATGETRQKLCYHIKILLQSGNVARPATVQSMAKPVNMLISGKYRRVGGRDFPHQNSTLRIGQSLYLDLNVQGCGARECFLTHTLPPRNAGDSVDALRRTAEGITEKRLQRTRQAWLP